jgi:hypothetical protein
LSASSWMRKKNFIGKLTCFKNLRTNWKQAWSNHQLCLGNNSKVNNLMSIKPITLCSFWTAYRHRWIYQLSEALPPKQLEIELFILHSFFSPHLFIHKNWMNIQQ